MENRMFQAGGCDALKINTTTQESQCNVPIFPPTMKQCGYNSLKSPNCLNYYDDLFSASTEMKEEFSEDECPQSSTAAPLINESSIDSNIVFENEDLSKVPKTQEIKQEVSEEALSFIKTEEIHEEKEMFIAKTEMPDEYQTLSNAGDTSVLYKAQTTQEIQPTMCGSILKNEFNLLTHNNEHIKIEPPTLVGNEGEELHKCKCCDEYFNHDNMLAHVYDVHSHKKRKSELCDESIKKIHAGRNVREINYKCDICKRTYTSRSTLVSHLKKIHYSNDRISEFLCGKQIPTPIHLHIHKKQQHDANIKSTKKAALKTEFQCDICKKMFKGKNSVIQHLLNVHSVCNKAFKCWCGKRFRTSLYLYKHKIRQHGTNAKSSDNAALKLEFQCNTCKKIFKGREGLRKHIINMHYDYCKTFKCWCGKQFRTPLYLRIHKNRQHSANIKSRRQYKAVLKTEFQCDICKKMFKQKGRLKQHILNIHCDSNKAFNCWCGKQFRSSAYLYRHKNRQHPKKANNAGLKKEFQCDVCKKMFKRKVNLKLHITSIHYDYGKTFKCWCGKQFRTPMYLRQHKNKQHNANVQSRNDAALKKEFQCDVCKKIFNTKVNLKRHITSIHYDYGKTFECWCGKQFRTPRYLDTHKNKQHGANSKNKNNAALKKEFQCDVCKKIFNKKGNLKIHITCIHYDYSKTFECWCGKQFPTPRYLDTHKNKQHGTNSKNKNNAALKKEFQCDVCKKMFKNKDNLRKHITNVHYDYGNIFECWCGKQFRTPSYLDTHKNKQHGVNIKSKNNAALKKEFQCDICKKMFKRKENLKQHILNIHSVCNKAFKCWCGKQFRKLKGLYQHNSKQHGDNIIGVNNAALKKEYQCDVCKKMFKSKRSLKRHITSIHYDYGKTFKCLCGKQFRTPRYLYLHKSRCHVANIKRKNNAALKIEFQCDICKKMFKSKRSLKRHITSIHYDYLYINT